MTMQNGAHLSKNVWPSKTIKNYKFANGKIVLNADTIEKAFKSGLTF